MFSYLTARYEVVGISAEHLLAREQEIRENNPISVPFLLQGKHSGSSMVEGERFDTSLSNRKKMNERNERDSYPPS
jgi:hypothetical protein